MNRASRSTRSASDLDRVALLAALCLFLSSVELLIPKPIPFMRLGLANLPIIVALDLLPASGVALLIALKIVGQALVNGTLFSYVVLFSTAGSLASGFFMLLLSRVWRGRLVGISVLGALASNLVQILLARFLIFGEGAWLIGPPLLAIGTVASVMLGLFAQLFVERSRWIAALGEGGAHTPPPRARVESRPGAVGAAARVESRPGAVEAGARARTDVAPTLLFLAGLAVVPAFAFQHSLVVRLAQAALFIALSVAAGKRFMIVPNLILLASVVAANLLTPFGRVLAAIGPLPITSGALTDGCSKAALLIGLVYLSRLMVRRDLRLPGRAGALVARVFSSFETITESGGVVRSALASRRSGRFRWSELSAALTAGIDELLERASGESAAPRESAARFPLRPTTFRGALLLAAFVGANWAALLLSARLP